MRPVTSTLRMVSCLRVVRASSARRLGQGTATPWRSRQPPIFSILYIVTSAESCATAVLIRYGCICFYRQADTHGAC